jgi:nucleotide-binding universal stress UspA family protein
MRTLRTVFAVVPGAESVALLLRAYQALPLANRSRLVCLYVSPLAIAYGMATDLALATYIEAQVQAAEEEREAAEAAFRRAAEKAGIAFEWRADTAMSHMVSPHAGSMARAAELILFPDLAGEGSLGRHQIEDLVFSAGRPVLAIPSGWIGTTLGEKIVVAWDGGREAARAVFDAIPFLTSAKLVRIVSVQGSTDEAVRQFTLGDDMAATLSRQGIPTESHTFQSSRRNVKEELLGQALDIGADMLVMGCYGHSRLREMILGGVSREMLTAMPLPLLLSN